MLAPPSALHTIILDTNPYAWYLLNETLPLQKAVANLLVFINAHLAINPANQVAVIASHNNCAKFLYPTPEITEKEKKHAHVEPAPPDANKYRPFATVEQHVLTNLRKLIAGTSPADLQSSSTTQIAGALTTALTYIAKQTILSAPSYNSAFLPTTEGAALPTVNSDGTVGGRRPALTSRILIVSVSGDLATQYIPVMNGIFAAQRQNIALDVLKLAGDTVFLQQASDATGGVYMAPSAPEGLLQYLMMAFLPDATARKSLVMPDAGDEVDFRAACFCHRKVVDVGFVCSVCLSSKFFRSLISMLLIHV